MCNFEYYALNILAIILFYFYILLIHSRCLLNIYKICQNYKLNLKIEFLNLIDMQNHIFSDKFNTKKYPFFMLHKNN